MNKYPTTISGYYNMSDLAEQVNNLRYDALEEFIYNLSCEMKVSSNKDLDKGKKELAASLMEASNYLMDASEFIDLSWQISEPFMKDDKDE